MGSVGMGSGRPVDFLPAPNRRGSAPIRENRRRFNNSIGSEIDHRFFPCRFPSCSFGRPWGASASSSAGNMIPERRRLSGVRAVSSDHSRDGGNNARLEDARSGHSSNNSGSGSSVSAEDCPTLPDSNEGPRTGGGDGGEAMPTAHLVALGIWAGSVGVFLLANYYWATVPFPAVLGAVDVRSWALVHAVSGTLFAGGILTTAFVEGLVISSGSQQVMDFWFNTATKAEAAMVLPGLTGSLVSGVAQAWIMYQRPLQYAPLHVKLPVHVLVLFGLWWAATDLATRDAARNRVKQNRRLVSNTVSCMLVLVLYGIMVLKPGN